MSVVCEQPAIAEKLVPYVEGALAEPDRSEVLDHLRGCEMCAGEVRVLKASILSLRQVFTRAGQYRPTTHISAEELERFAFEPETLSAEVMRGVKLHLAECGDCEQEVTLLREMEQELAEKVEAVRAPETLPQALREAVGRQFGATSNPEDPVASRRPWMESLLVWLASLSPKPLLAAGGAMVVLFVGIQFVQRLPEGAPSVPAQVATTNTRANAASKPVSGVGVATPAAAAFGASREVALLPGRVDSQELPGYSRKLWESKVSHSYRDGQIFVASEDVDRARKALEIVPREVAAVDLSLDKRKAVAEGLAGPKVAGQVAEPTALPPQDSATTMGAGADRKVEADQATAQAPFKPAEPARPSARPQANPVARAAISPAVRPAAAAPRPASSPIAPPRPAVVAAKKPAPVGTEIAVLTPKTAKGGELANPRQQVARPPVQQQVAVAPNSQVLRGGADSVAQLPVRSATDEQPKNAQEPAEGFREEKERPAPPPAPAAAGEVRKDGSDRVGMATRSTSAGAGGAPPYSNVGNVGTVNTPATTMPSGAGRAPGNRMDDSSAGDSALLTQARKVATEAVGDATVSLDKREDGSVVVTVRSGRALSSQEMDHLRKALRQHLNLADSDTVVIRQP